MLNLRWKVVIIEVGGANNIMEFRVLKYFLMVAREENITKAAALLHLTQPTLSRQLMQLEAEVSLSDKTVQELSHKEDVPSGEIAIGCGETKSILKMLFRYYDRFDVGIRHF